jgi:hypothetical protein
MGTGSAGCRLIRLPLPAGTGLKELLDSGHDLLHSYFSSPLDSCHGYRCVQPVQDPLRLGRPVLLNVEEHAAADRHKPSCAADPDHALCSCQAPAPADDRRHARAEGLLGEETPRLGALSVKGVSQGEVKGFATMWLVFGIFCLNELVHYA